MDNVWKSTMDGYMKVLYDMNPKGAVLERVKSFEHKFIEVAEQNPGNYDIVGVLTETGLQSEYTGLYMAVMGSGETTTNQSQTIPKDTEHVQTQQLPTVSEFLSAYKTVYDQVKNECREETDIAYQKLFDVQNRTDDLIDAQIIIENENLIVNTVTSDYKAIAREFLEAVDPNYEVTSAMMNATVVAYGNATSLDEVTYLGEISRGRTDDLAVQIPLKVEMMLIFMGLIFAWENAKRKVREGGKEIDKNAKAMVVSRDKMRSYYKFMNEDMGISFEDMIVTPFYRILLLYPEGLDALWRIKKVMHPDNLKAMEHVLFQEILTDKSLEEILLTPQVVPYYEMIDTVKVDRTLDEEFAQIARELNKDIKYLKKYQDTSTDSKNVQGNDLSQEGIEKKKAQMSELINKAQKMDGEAALLRNKISNLARF
ncbi:MAG: hypothetical protein RR495_05355 [Anaerovoracaceae bacterium]